VGVWVGEWVDGLVECRGYELRVYFSGAYLYDMYSYFLPVEM
jgi:hypothetical protein